MNILMMNYEYPPLGGGGGVFNRQLAEELSKNNSITVITSKFGGLKPHEVINGVKIRRVPVLKRDDQNVATIVSMLSFFPGSLRAGYKLLKSRPFDVIHSMFAIPSAPSGLALAKKFHIPHVLSILGGDIYDPSKTLSPHKAPILHQAVTKIMEASESVVALSSDIKNRALIYYNVDRDIEVIHIGIPKPLFTERTRIHFNFGRNDILLVTVGRLVPRKGLEDLIRVLQDLGNMKIKLVIIGDGPEKTRLAKLSHSLNLSDRVFFLGYISDEEKFQLLSISDIYLSSSQHEGFGIVFLEAMATGLPIVCYDKGGQTDFLINNKTGFLVSHGDRELLTKRIGELSESEQLRKQISVFNSHYIERFYISKCAERYQFLYDSLVEKGKKGTKQVREYF
jgi:glycosyltransferase involved in cell wall biosynthesis